MKALLIILLLHTATLLCYAFQIDNIRQSVGASVSRARVIVAEKHTKNNRRRSFIQNIIFTSALISSSPNINGASAAEETNLPKISHKVYFDVRISRSDGSFYVSTRDFVLLCCFLFILIYTTTYTHHPFASLLQVRDATPENGLPTDEPFYGQLVLGLFGNDKPNHVQQFLSYVDVPFDLDAPLPSYSRSKFQTFDAATGLLIGGTVSIV